MVRSILAAVAVVPLGLGVSALTKPRQAQAEHVLPQTIAAQPVAYARCPNGRGDFVRCAAPAALPRVWAL